MEYLRKSEYKEEYDRKILDDFQKIQNTVLNLSKLKKYRTATVLKCFAIFQNIVYSLEPGETPSNSASHQAPNYAQRF